jgi:hypothetical protein
MNKIPLLRLLIYVILCGWIPIALVLFGFFYQKKLLNAQEVYVDSVYQTYLLEGEKQELNEIVYQHFRNADRRYIEEQLETLSFLHTEKEKIRQLLQLEVFRDHDTLQKRLEFLSGVQNQLIFVEGEVEAYPHYKETILSLAHPVEIDTDDLKKLLAKIEGIQIGQNAPLSGCPQFMMTEFKLERKSREGQNEFFRLEMKLLKRDYF